MHFDAGLSVLRTVLANEINHGEQADPDNVNEVPVVRHDDRGGGLAMGKSARNVGSPEDKKEGDQSSGDVHTVEARRQVEHRPVRRRRQRESFFDEFGVLGDLSGNED